MIEDPERRGRELATLYGTLAPRLFADLEESVLETIDPARKEQARQEWDLFALYACIRGLVAAGGFNRETARAIDAFHETVIENWSPAAAHDLETRRALVSERYAEYGAIGQAGGAAGAATVAHRLGAAAARHIAGGEPSEGLAEVVGELHESLAEGAAESIRRGT